MYARNRPLAYEIYLRAKAFGCKPSDVALLAECVEEIGRYYFDRGIWAFGRDVDAKVDEAGQSKDSTIARTQREREWERLMGADMSNSTAGFADPGSAMAARDDSDDDDIELG